MNAMHVTHAIKNALAPLLLVFAIAGCGKGSASGGGPVPDQWTQEMPADHGMAMLPPGGDPGPNPNPTPTPTPMPIAPFSGHGAGRLTVDQLRLSIPALFGGITWEVRRGTGQISGFDALSRTLGEADYVAITSDNREPSPIFEKFMDDMAGNVCGQAVAHDHMVPAGDQRLVMQSDTDIDQNLRFLRLKLHGLYVAPDSMEGIQELRGLYDGCVADSNNSSDAGWNCVCVAMLTAPEFQAY